MVNILCPEGRNFTVDSYTYTKYGGVIVLRIYNPKSYNDIVDYVEQCNFMSFDLVANYPGKREKKHHFVSYDLSNYFVCFKESGTVLEFYLNKLEVI